MAYCIMDKGGTGDCAYRSAAAAIADKQSKEIPDDNLIQEGSRLRLLDVSHLTTDKAEPSQDLATYLRVLAKREMPGRHGPQSWQQQAVQSSGARNCSA